MSHISTQREGDVLHVILDRPEARNAQTPSMWEELAGIGASLGAEVRAVILRGAGPSFSAGLDRRMFTPEGIPGEPSLLGLAALASDEQDSWIAQAQSAFRWLRECDAVTVAAVQGHAVGAGFQLALASDLMVVAPDAQLAMRETSLGLVPDLAGTLPLLERVGYSRALEICASGRWVGADEAVRLGIATVGADDPVAGAEALLEPILAAMPGAVTALKGLLRDAAGRGYDEQCRAERGAQTGRLAELAALMRG